MRKSAVSGLEVHATSYYLESLLTLLLRKKGLFGLLGNVYVIFSNVNLLFMITHHKLCA